MKKSLWILLGIVTAYVLSMVLSSSTTYMMRSLFHVASLEHPPFYYKLFDLSYSLFYVGLAAYVATWIAKSKIAPIIFGVVFFILSIIVLVGRWDSNNPIWYQISYMILVLPTTLLGGYLRWKNFKKIDESAI